MTVDSLTDQSRKLEPHSYPGRRLSEQVNAVLVDYRRDRIAARRGVVAHEDDGRPAGGHLYGARDHAF